MMKWSCLLFSPVLLLFLVASSPAQAIFAGTETARIQAGAGGMYLNTDYSGFKNDGLAFWGDYDFNGFIGLEADAHLGGLIAPGDIGENSYLVGPRLMYRRRRATGYGKLMVGRATITDQALNQSSSFNVYAYGGGLEYKVSRKWNVRVVDVELQRWPNFRPSAISPLSLTIGLSYIIR